MAPRGTGRGRRRGARRTRGHGPQGLTEQRTRHGAASWLAARRYRGDRAARVRNFLSGLELVEPGIVPVDDWRPDPQTHRDAVAPVVLAAVGRKS
ncbi:MAG TPA: SAM-dependent methyltransferase [Pseudonocardiaceae bacterium]